jgi:hypothetical protein
VEKFLREENEKLKPDDYFRHVANAYLNNVSGKTDAIKRQVEELKGKMEKERLPQAHKFVLILQN